MWMIRYSLNRFICTMFANSINFNFLNAHTQLKFLIQSIFYAFVELQCNFQPETESHFLVTPKVFTSIFFHFNSLVHSRLIQSKPTLWHIVTIMLCVDVAYAFNQIINSIEFPVCRRVICCHIYNYTLLKLE